MQRALWWFALAQLLALSDVGSAVISPPREQGLVQPRVFDLDAGEGAAEAAEKFTGRRNKLAPVS